MDSSAPACHDRRILARFRHREHDFHGMARVFSPIPVRIGPICANRCRLRNESTRDSRTRRDPASAGAVSCQDSRIHGGFGSAIRGPSSSLQLLSARHRGPRPGAAGRLAGPADPRRRHTGGAAESSLPRTRPLTHRSDAAVGPLYRILDIAPADRDHGVRDMLDA
ncbi:hypothetical protein [Burkholderia plantarii]|uniref:hypothetical protein n=1 Tax=Burkholderia plantarii TaxID=41899 RepID=UPI000A88D5E1|nr:hypothetical protein [Burkholderia plantarii]